MSARKYPLSALVEKLRMSCIRASKLAARSQALHARIAALQDQVAVVDRRLSDENNIAAGYRSHVAMADRGAVAYSLELVRGSSGSWTAIRFYDENGRQIATDER